MKVGFLQFNPAFGKKHQNFKKVKELLTNCNADLITLPELFNTGYTFLNIEELTRLAEPLTGGETAEFIFSIAKEKGCCVAFGFAEKEGNHVFNSMALMSSQGLIGVYRKAHLYFEEKNLFQPGDTGFKVFEYKGVKLGMLVCYDWIYPEAMRTLAIKGAQIILHAANLVMSYCPNAMITRALENRVFIVTADRIGKERRNRKEYQFIGQSQVVSPRGEILVRVGYEECAKVVTIDPAEAIDKKVTEYNDLLRDRREDFYFK